MRTTADDRSGCHGQHRVGGWRVTVFDQLARELGSRRGVAAADRLCELCVERFEVDAAALSLVFDGANAGTLGASGATARVYDEMQFVLGEGPCLSSVSDRAPVLVPDLDGASLARWPLYTGAMLDLGVRAVYAVPVVVAGEFVGALDLFRHAPGDLPPEAIEGALAVAVLAEIPLLDLLASGERLAAGEMDGADWLELNASTRMEVSQATGVLMSQLDIDATEALVRLRAHAYSEGRRVTDVARDILERRLRLEP